MVSKFWNNQVCEDLVMVVGIGDLGTILIKDKSYLQKLVVEAIEKIKNDSDDSAVPPMRCPIEKEISIIEQIVGPSVGTVVRGMGCLAVRAPRMRGPAKGTSMSVSTINEDDLRRQLAERDEEIRLLKEGQEEAKKEVDDQRKMILSLMRMYGGASDANSNSTTPTNNALAPPTKKTPAAGDIFHIAFFQPALPPTASFFSGLLLQLHYRSGMEQTVDSQPTKRTMVRWKMEE